MKKEYLYKRQHDDVQQMLERQVSVEESVLWIEGIS